MPPSIVFPCCLLLGSAIASNVCQSETGCLDDVAASFVQISRHAIRANHEDHSNRLGALEASKQLVEVNGSKDNLELAVEELRVAEQDVHVYIHASVGCGDELGMREFRKLAKKLGFANASVADRIFRDVDTDGSGIIDLKVEGDESKVRVRMSKHSDANCKDHSEKVGVVQSPKQPLQVNTSKVQVNISEHQASKHHEESSQKVAPVQPSAQLVDPFQAGQVAAVQPSEQLVEVGSSKAESSNEVEASSAKVWAALLKDLVQTSSRRDASQVTQICSAEWAFLMSNTANLVGILKGPRSGTANLVGMSDLSGSGKTELHIPSASSDYQEFGWQINTGMAYSFGQGEDWDFGMQANGDLVGVLKGPVTASGKTEVHILSAASNYQKFSLQTDTALAYTSGGDWAFAVKPDGDLVGILKGPVTDSGKTEVHVLSALSKYRTYVLQVGTGLDYTTGQDWTFQVKENGDLMGILKGPVTLSGKTEVHILSAASNYQDAVLATGTPLGITDINWDFALMPTGNLAGILKGPVTDSGRTELHILEAASNYQTWALQSGTCMAYTNSICAPAKTNTTSASTTTTTTTTTALPSQLRFRASPVDCSKMRQPLQVVLASSGYSVMELDIDTGNYTSLFEITFDAVDGGFSELNACGINPVDSYIYCTMFAKGAYIVRIGPSVIEFVARLPWAVYNSGGFAASGTYFVATGRSLFYAVKDLHKAKAFPDTERNSPKIVDLRNATKHKPQGFGSCADVVPVDADLQGNGVEEYIFVLYGPKLQIAKWDSMRENFSESWIIPVKPPRWDHIYGAGWNFQGQVYFASNGGHGVYEVPLENLTLNKEFPSGFKLELNRIGDSATIAASDGMNCLNQPSPWTTSLRPFDCSAFPGPIQALIHEEGYDIKFLDMDSGNYSEIYTILKNRSSTPFKFLNAFSIGSEDYIVYASLVMDEWNMSIYPTPPPFYIVRIDLKNIEFVAKVQAPFGSPIAGTFDEEGNFYIVSNPSLLKFPAVASMKGFASHDDPALPFFGPDSSTVAIKNITGARQIADIVAVTGNFDGEGDAKWVLAVNAYMQLICMKVDVGEFHILDTNDVLGTSLRQNFGAGWNFMGQVYFASNDGAGVFQVPLDKIQVPDGPGIVLEKVGDSAPIYNNDGMNCIRTYSPFSKKAGTYIEPFGARVLQSVTDMAKSLLGVFF